jgi:hypothetical protein
LLRVDLETTETSRQHQALDAFALSVRAAAGHDVVHFAALCNQRDAVQRVSDCISVNGLAAPVPLVRAWA